MAVGSRNLITMRWCEMAVLIVGEVYLKGPSSLLLFGCALLAVLRLSSGQRYCSTCCLLVNSIWRHGLSGASVGAHDYPRA